MTKKLKIIAIVFTLLLTINISPLFAFIAKTTSYTGSEDGNYRTCTGERLREGMVAADLSVYALGTKISIDGDTYIVADCGSAIKGRKHFDVFCSSMRRMNARGTIYADVHVIGKNDQIASKKPAEAKLVVKNSYSHRLAPAKSNYFTNKSLSLNKTCVYSSKRAARFERKDVEVMICME